MIISKRRFCAPEQVLTVEKRNGALEFRLVHRKRDIKITPLGPLCGKSAGGELLCSIINDDAGVKDNGRQPRTIAKSMNTLIPLILSLSKDGLTGA